MEASGMKMSNGLKGSTKMVYFIQEGQNFDF